jgi:hypothetical protein
VLTTTETAWRFNDVLFDRYKKKHSICIRLVIGHAGVGGVSRSVEATDCEKVERRISIVDDNIIIISKSKAKSSERLYMLRYT